LAGFTAIAAVGKSIERLLAQAFVERQPVPTKTAKVVLIRTEDLDGNGIKNLVGDIGLTILLYRVDFNKTMRAAWAARAEDDGRGHLALDLHFLLTPWADNAEHQHMIIGRAMQVIERVAMLAGPLLYEPALPSPAYDDEPRASSIDSVQLLLEEISTEALMRTFDSLPGDYHLCVPYVARVVRIDTLAEIVAPPVIDADIEMRVN
jgi:hypothetical protein